MATTMRDAEIIKDGKALTPNGGCDIYTIVAERPADLFRLLPFTFFTTDATGWTEWEAGTVLAADGTGRSRVWRKAQA